jgi:general secretion pathway protein G
VKKIQTQSGFTLVELMIVIVIIGILAGVVLLNVGPMSIKARRARAAQDIANMSSAIDIYQADNGFYPTSQQGLQALLSKPNTPPVPKNWQGPYLRNLKKAPADPWGSEYVYKSPGEHNPDSFDLYSLGPDGRPGGEGNNAADIVPWDE